MFIIATLVFLFHCSKYSIDSNQLVKTSMCKRGCWNQNIELSLDNYLVDYCLYLPERSSKLFVFPTVFVEKPNKRLEFTQHALVSV